MEFEAEPEWEVPSQQQQWDLSQAGDPRWYQREVIAAELPGEDAVDAEDEESDPYYLVRKADTGRGDIYLAARTGDLKRVQYVPLQHRASKLEVLTGVGGRALELEIGTACSACQLRT